MFIVYALHSVQFDKIYIGFTSNLEERLISHNQLSMKGYTVKYRPWELFFTEACDTKANAMKREKQLKSARTRKRVFEIITKK